MTAETKIRMADGTLFTVEAHVEDVTEAFSVAMRSGRIIILADPPGTVRFALNAYQLVYCEGTNRPNRKKRRRILGEVLTPWAVDLPKWTGTLSPAPSP